VSIEITEEFVQQYTRGIDLLVQQKGSRFRNAVSVETGIRGKQAFFDQIGATSAVKRTTRHGDTPIINTPHARRAVPMIDYEWADLVDDPDKIKILNDPTNSYSMNAAHAMSRALDAEIIDAATGVAATGETGSGLSGTPAVIPNGGSNLDVAILAEFSEALKADENDQDEEWYMTLSSASERQLIASATATVASRDFVSDQPVVSGKLQRLMGFNFIHTERLNLDGSGHQIHFAWRKSALKLAIGKDSTGRISERPDKSYSMQVFYSMTIGAVRMEEEGVKQIAIDPAA
jgi:hypothetical protein